MQPEVMAKITNYTHYANSNLAANDYVEATNKNDPVMYPGEADLARLATLRTRSDQGQRTISRVWSQFRSGQ
jgi:putrescine transport system substrate-binding protein